MSSLSPQNERFSFVMGLLTAGGVAAVLALFIVYTTGWQRVVNALSPLAPSHRQVLDIPAALLAEMQAGGMIVDNANNPTKAKKHQTFLVRPSEEMGYVLHPNVAATGYVLTPANAFNFDPPVLYHLEGVPLSAELSRYLENRSLLRFSLTTDAAGRRRTLPEVTASRKVLMIGDSVPFGVGVDDALTAASQLQRLLGSDVQVVNAGVGGYDGRQAIRVAEKSAGEGYEALIYVACQNDFMTRGDDWSAEARHVLRSLAPLAPQYGGRIIVVLHSYLEYNARHVFRSPPWDQTDALRAAVREETDDAAFTLIDWADLYEAFQKASGSIFAGFALYVDHCHFSPQGNALVARHLAAHFADPAARLLSERQPAEQTEHAL